MVCIGAGFNSHRAALSLPEGSLNRHASPILMLFFMCGPSLWLASKAHALGALWPTRIVGTAAVFLFIAEIAVILRIPKDPKREEPPE